MNLNKIHKAIRRFGRHVEDVHTAYSSTGAVDTTWVDVSVGYGSGLTAETVYTYSKGRKTKMRVSVSHGRPAQSRETTYAYDAIGRLSGKQRQLTGTGRSLCSYSYDVHGWLTSVVNGEFQERLYYADGLDGGCWNGNISTMKWRSGDNGFYEGYNLKYDGNNRLYSAAFGSGDNFTGNGNCFSENVEYDCNGNITKLRRLDNTLESYSIDNNMLTQNISNLSESQSLYYSLNSCGFVDTNTYQTVDKLNNDDYGNAKNGETRSGRIISICSSNPLTGKHEMGHTVGLGHHPAGLMTSSSSDENRNDQIYATYIKEILKGFLPDRNGVPDAGKGHLIVNGENFDSHVFNRIRKNK